MTNDDFIKQVKALLQMHAEGLLGGEVMPEDALLDIVPESELPNVLTLGMALNYQRNAYALWKAVAKTYLDEGARWVFHPQTVSETSLAEVGEVLGMHRIALQPNRHPEIWQRVATGITRSTQTCDVMGLLASVQFDIAVLKDRMQVTRKAEFPYLSGPKIFNYWLYVMETYTGIQWKSREMITIAPDTHILQASVKLGLCSAEVLRGTVQDRQEVAAAWETVLDGSGLAPIDIHTPLWLWSRADFPSLDQEKRNAASSLQIH